MANPAFKRAWSGFLAILWALLALLLPVTSFPPVKKLTGADMVSPASGPILLVFLICAILPLLWRQGQVPRAMLPLFGFIFSVIISAALSIFLPIPSFRDLPFLNNMLKSLFTLAVGVSFFLAVALWSRDPAHAAAFLRGLNWGGLIVIIWSCLQVGFFYYLHVVPMWMQDFQFMVSTGGLYHSRAPGFAFEPSWLAHQLNMLYLPFWLAAALRGSTVHRLRFGWLTFERVLLLGGLATLWFTVSRIGFLSFIFCLILIFGMAIFRGLSLLKKRIMASRQTHRAWVSFFVSLGLILGLLLVGLLLVLLGGFVLSKVDPRMKSIFNVSSLSDFSLLQYANQLVFAERLVFWETGWNIFNDYPIFGVGLGNAGFFFSQKLSFYAWGLTETRTNMYHLSSIPNIKSLWVRLLAETGVFGMGMFLSWLYVIYASALRLYRRTGLAGTVGLAGFFVLVGLLTEGFSIDSFALPYYWVSFGLVTALAAGNSAHAAHEAVPDARPWYTKIVTNHPRNGIPHPQVPSSPRRPIGSGPGVGSYLKSTLLEEESSEQYI